MSRLSQLAVSKRSVTLLLAAALFVAGISAWGSLKQELLPDIEFPIVTVVAAYPGAGSSDVAEQVTKPIECAISGVTVRDQLIDNEACCCERKNEEHEDCPAGREPAPLSR